MTDALEAVPDGFALFDPDGALLWCNGRYRALTEGLSPAGPPVAPGSEPVEMRLGNGRWIRVLGRTAPDGGTVSVVRDITELRLREDETEERSKRELERKDELLRLIFENMGQGITLLDQDLRIIASNRKALEMLDLPEHVADRAMSLRDTVRFRLSTGRIALPPDAPDFGDDVESKIDWLLDRFARPPRETVYIRPTGDGRVLEIRAVPLPDGRQVRVYTDVTERVQAEEGLRAAKERAETALAELERAQESLIQAEKMASLAGLVAGVAHEINTPVGVTLTCISHFAEEIPKLQALFLQNRMRRSDFEEFMALAWETSQMILANIERAADLIQSFKQIAVDQASAERRRFDLHEYVGEVILSLHPRFRTTRVRVDAAIPQGIEVDGYPGAFSQVLSNLLINALVHAFDEGQPGLITLEARDAAAGMVELVYRDNGRGIPARVRSRIWEPFFTTKRGAGASGLGLNIVYNIVTRTMGGTIALEGEEGQGAAFILRFPRMMPDPAPADES